MNTVQERIGMLAMYAGNKSLKALASDLGLNTQMLYDLKSGKTKEISGRLANKIFLVFPEVSKTWLLTGEGEMLQCNSSDDSVPVENELNNQHHLIETIYSQQETIAQLTRMLGLQLGMQPAPKKEKAG